MNATQTLIEAIRQFLIAYYTFRDAPNQEAATVAFEELDQVVQATSDTVITIEFEDCQAWKGTSS